MKESSKKSFAEIKIKNLKLRAVIGIHEWERKNKQDVVINISIFFDASAAAETDRLEDTVDYKAIKQNIISLVESSSFYLLEKLASEVLALCMADPLVLRAAVEIDKPHALRFADSVSITMTDEK